MSLQKIASFLKGCQDVTILTHISPDGDALGSSFALQGALSLLGISSQVVLPEPIPAFFTFMNWKCSPYSEGMPVDTLVALDCGDSRRLGAAEDLLARASRSVMLDHHKAGIPFGDLHFVDPTRSATGEIIFDLLGELGVQPDTEIAKSLYVAISTDTGGFRYSNTTPRTHQIVSRLLEEAIDAAAINRHLYDCVPYPKLKLTALALDALKFYHDGKIAVIAATLEMLQKSGATQEDTDCLTDYTRIPEGVEIGILLKEKSADEVKISLRSNEYADVSSIAQSFSGGGHQRASGCVIHSSISDAQRQIVAAAEKVL